MNEKISVIIPCYNAEKYLEKCLDSVINQTYKNLEIICVNDGSTDNTLQILENYAQKDDRIVIVNQNNAGLSGARNSGMKKVTGEYIIFVDSDDWIDSNTCEISLSKCIDKNVDLVIWNYIKEYGNSSVNKLIFQDKEIYFDSNECEKMLHRRIFGLYGEELKNPENADSLVTAWGKLYKSALIIDNHIEFVDTKKIGTEDALFNAMVFCYLKSAIYIPNCFNHYRKDNEQSLTTVYKPELFERWQNLYKLMDEIISKNNLDNSFVTALNNRIALSIINLGLNELSNPKGTISQIKNISKIIHIEKYKNAYKNLELKYFPIHWKIFFFFAKHRCSLGLFVLLKVINMLRGKTR